MFRNEWTLYKRKCDLCGKEMITMHSPDKPRKVYCNPCWWSDKWDASDYAADYDPNRNFFEQFGELQKKVPFMALICDYSTLINSDYVNHAGNSKNSYFVFNADFMENSCYLTQTNNAKECMEGYSIFFTEFSYEGININKSYGVYYSEDIESSQNIYFSKNLSGCGDCFGCINLRNKHYYIFNEPYSREEYKKKLAEFNLGSSATVREMKEKARAFWLKSPHKFYHGAHNVNSSGDYLYYCKNVTESYLVNGGEDMKFCQWINMKPVKDAYDYTEWGMGGERIYECVTAGQGASDIRMSHAIWMGPTTDIEYCLYVLASNHMFGSIGMRKKEHCILNKQYTKEEYGALREKIISDMQAYPYMDARGRKFSYGEFFPYDLSLYDYNESSAHEYFPFDRDGAEAQGWRWKEKENILYQITKKADDLPDHINGVPDAIVKETIACASCGRAYRIIQQELDLLRRFGLPAPRLCFECRHRARLVRLNPMRFYPRQCQCAGQGSTNGVYPNAAEHFHGASACPNEFETSYAPERPEIVYCESCYQAEVA